MRGASMNEVDELYIQNSILYEEFLTLHESFISDMIKLHIHWKNDPIPEGSSFQDIYDGLKHFEETVHLASSALEAIMQSNKSEDAKIIKEVSEAFKKLLPSLENMNKLTHQLCVDYNLL